MKKFLIITTLLFFIPLTIEKYQQEILAADEKATSSAETELDERIKGIKQGVAEKVAKLKLLQNRAFSGRIDSLTDKSFDLETKMGELILVQINEATTINLKKGAKNTQTSLDKLSKDEKVVVWGRYNSEEKSLSAQKIISRLLPESFVGQIEAIDPDNNRLTIRQLNSAGIKVLPEGQVLNSAGIKVLPEGHNQLITVNTDEINTVHQLDNKLDFVKKRLKDLKVSDGVYIYGFGSESDLFIAHRLLIINAATSPTPADKKY